MYTFHTNFDKNWPLASNIKMGTQTHVQPTFFHFMMENNIECQKNSFNSVFHIRTCSTLLHPTIYMSTLLNNCTVVKTSDKQHQL